MFIHKVRGLGYIRYFNYNNITTRNNFSVKTKWLLSLEGMKKVRVSVFYFNFCSVYIVEELQRDRAKALEVGAHSHHGPAELQEEENYVMCK